MNELSYTACSSDVYLAALPGTRLNNHLNNYIFAYANQIQNASLKMFPSKPGQLRPNIQTHFVAETTFINIPDNTADVWALCLCR